MRCEEIMTRNPATCPADATCEQAAKLMAERDIGFVPVVDQSGKALGVLTDRDIVVKCIARGGDCKTEKLQGLVGNDIIAVEPSDDVSKAKDLMAMHKVQRILVCDPSGKPVGVISLQDLAESDEEQEVGSTVREVKEQAPQSIH
jgi:CBS domain-containing protein